MPLTPGQRLGPYQVISTIGVGGMGEVYRARDLRLNRDVAIKTLPALFATDADRLARFRREAQTLAALNHPNIAHIHGLEECPSGPEPGQEATVAAHASVLALVMELVEGEDLSARLAHGPMPLPEVLAIARQIAEALEAAHEQGIVHRDLKPANIKVRPDGTVKVLDFGLAKAIDPSSIAGRTGPGTAATAAPTITTPAMMTGMGMLLGTAAYMSPEQAKGHPADRRSDIWAFGCIVYEMLTGKRLFQGEDVSDTIANVLKWEPNWEALPHHVPASVRRLLRRCLERDLRRRLRDIGDAQLELHDAVHSPEGSYRGVAVPVSRGRILWVLLAGSIVVATIAAVYARRPRHAAQELRVDINTPPGSDVASFAVSPDGTSIAFVAADHGQQRLWLRSFDSSSARVLAGTDGARLPFWAPAGRSLAFFSDTRLKRLDLDSGSLRTLAPVVMPGGGSWNRDGTILYVPNYGVGPIMRVDAGGGEPSVVAQSNPHDIGNRLPFFLPDARHFVFYVAGGPDPRGVYLGEIGQTLRKRLLTADAPARYTAGHLLFVRDGVLFAQPFDPDKGEITGTAVRVADAVAVNAGGIDALSASAEGAIAYRSGGSERTRELLWFDRSGNRIGASIGRSLPAVNVGSVLVNPALSPDGRHVAVQHGGDIWIIDLDRDVDTRFTSDPGIEALPVWSPDGARIAFDSPRKGPADLYAQRTDGSGAEQLLLSTPDAKFPCDWSRDGRLLLYKSIDAKTGVFDLWALRLDEAGAQPFPVVRTDFDERDGQFSPDGRWIAYESNESGQPEIYVQRFLASGGKTRISTAGGTQVRWRSDGRELFYIGADSRLMAVRFDESGGQDNVGAPVPLFATNILTAAGIPRQQYVVSPDGQRFLINTVTGDEGASPIRLILNWRAQP